MNNKPKLKWNAIAQAAVNGEIANVLSPACSPKLDFEKENVNSGK